MDREKREKIKDSEREFKLHQKTLPQDWNITLTTMASTEQMSYLWVL